MKNPLLVAIIISGGVLLSGCQGSKASYTGNIADDTVGNDSGAEIVEITDTIEPTFSPNPVAVNDERQVIGSLLQERVLYFEYDKSLIGEDSTPIIAAHAEFLNNNPDKGIVLGGHADSRGSNEYNLALGQRRADSVRDTMLSLGVSSQQIESLSFGEESPSTLGDSEEAWRLNRRVEIRYTDE